MQMQMAMAVTVVAIASDVVLCVELLSFACYRVKPSRHQDRQPVRLRVCTFFLWWNQIPTDLHQKASQERMLHSRFSLLNKNICVHVDESD